VSKRVRYILGSRSPRRREILQSLFRGIEFEVVAANLDEKDPKYVRPAAPTVQSLNVLTLQIARDKSEHIAAMIGDPAVIVTADTVVLCDGELREKPVDTDQAYRYLASYEDSFATCVTSVVVRNTQTGWRGAVTDVAEVHFRPFLPLEIETITQDPSILRMAGGFSIDHPLFAGKIRRVIGDRGTVLGLPYALTQLLIQDAIISRSSH